MQCPKCHPEEGEPISFCGFCHGSGYVPDGSLYYRRDTEGTGYIEISKYSTEQKAKLLVYRGGIGAIRTDLTLKEMQELCLVLLELV